MPRLEQPIVIIDGMRTAIGSPFRSLKGLTVAQLAAAVIEGLLARNKMKDGSIREVILGNTVSAGTGQNFARQAVFLAGLPITTPAFTVNNVCGSGLQSVIIAINSILAGRPGLVIAGGAESASQAPNLVSKDETVALQNKSPVESLIYDGLWCLMTGKHMGELCEAMADEYKIGRQVQDAYALSSHQKIAAAIEQGNFQREIAPIAVSKSRTFLIDERPRKNLRPEQLAELPAAFRDHGTITAGNASVPSDGAAALILGSAKAAQEENLTPIAKITGYVSLAVEPAKVFTAGIEAIRQCCAECRWPLEQVDLFEMSEAFAAQAVLTREQLKIPENRFNVCGGDIALGHPLGAAGVRALVTLIHTLRRMKKKTGVVCVCLGGGGAIAIAVEVV